ncbi:hypothetical protein RIF29_13488 [Crotalaria pallida]|uniref:GDSL esterase/lipase n=1 Tax=Crotalaria pallida TaxID=3830 RepID=A0AAN9P236_CROPI
MDHLFTEALLMVVLVLFANKVPIAAAYPALFAFGDSILDTGNNNNLQTLTKCNYPPYGKDFNRGTPTGRFSDGKVPSDLIAGALKIKDTLPAYNDPNLKVQELPTGVCFASGGSGLDNQTSSMMRVISLSDQLQMFKDYIGKLTSSVGQQGASDIISNSLFLLSAGNNDIAIAYSFSSRRKIPFPDYANLLVGSASSFLKDIYELGARHVWVLSTLPLGCLPGGRATSRGLCNEMANEHAIQFNRMLQQQINSITTSTPNYKVDFVDVYTPLLSIIQNPIGSGFINAVSGCCGGTFLAFGELCNLLTNQCLDPSTYVFWDFAHPSEKAYQIIVSDIIQKHNSFVTSSN